MISISAHGEKELRRRMRLIAKYATSTKLKKEALNEGAEIIRREIEHKAPTGPRGKPDQYRLKRNIIKDFEHKAGEITARAGPDYRKTAVGHLVEYGHRIVTGSRKKGTLKDTGKRVPAHPFMRPAYKTRKDESANRIGEVLWEGIKWKILQLRRGSRG